MAIRYTRKEEIWNASSHGGGILLGVVECISYKITAIAPYTDAIEFSVLIIILLVRPTGFLGKKRREKV